MNKELQQKLFDKYPKIFQNVGKTPQESCMAFGIETGDGWYSLIENLCFALQDLTDRQDLPQVVAEQVKEKFGGLRFYVSGATDKQYTIIEFVEFLSSSVCEKCGSMDKAENRPYKGWYMTRCEKCRKEYNDDV